MLLLASTAYMNRIEIRLLRFTTTVEVNSGVESLIDRSEINNRDTKKCCLVLDWVSPIWRSFTRSKHRSEIN